MTKKEAMTAPSLVCMFEEIMQGKGLFIDTGDWRDLRTHCHVKWLDPLIETGAIKKTGEHPAWPEGPLEGARQYNYYNFAVTPEGMKWWIDERVKELDCKDVEPSKLAESGWGPDLNIRGKGIGSGLHLWWPWHVVAAFKSIQAGYFNLERYQWGHPRGRFHDIIDVSLTPKGFEYFGAIPIPEWEVAT